MVIVVGGMIGLGKTSATTILAKHFNSKAFYESVDDNPILPLFYKSTEEEIQSKRYPFLLQLHFLSTRFQMIKKALKDKNNVLDRSIYEDLYFCQKNKELGRISDLEYHIYKNLLNNMLDELDELPKKSPDLMVYLTGSFDTVMNRIKVRGRDFEIDDKLIDYYRYIWIGYDDYIKNVYSASPVVIVDMDKLDIVNNDADKEYFLNQVEEKIRGVVTWSTNKC